MSTSTTTARETEVTILGRLLGDDRGQFTPEMARHILDRDFSDRDKARMHDLAVRNQDDALTELELEELHAYGKAGDVLAILKSKARRTLGIKPTKRIIDREG